LVNPKEFPFVKPEKTKEMMRQLKVKDFKKKYKGPPNLVTYQIIKEGYDALSSFLLSISDEQIGNDYIDVQTLIYSIIFNSFPTITHEFQRYLEADKCSISFFKTKYPDLWNERYEYWKFKGVSKYSSREKIKDNNELIIGLESFSEKYRSSLVNDSTINEDRVILKEIAYLSTSSRQGVRTLFKKYEDELLPVIEFILDPNLTVGSIEDLYTFVDQLNLTTKFPDRLQQMIVRTKSGIRHENCDYLFAMFKHAVDPTSYIEYFKEWKSTFGIYFGNKLKSINDYPSIYKIYCQMGGEPRTEDFNLIMYVLEDVMNHHISSVHESLKSENPELYDEIANKLKTEKKTDAPNGELIIVEPPTILYGPPGTGKTYAIQKDYIGQSENSQLITFHQSYSYEDFVEGIKPNLKQRELEYELVDGAFKVACEKAFELANKPRGTDGHYYSIDALIKETTVEERSNFFKSAPTYTLCIDEINRGNVAAIFGELITLIEESKRLGQIDEDGTVTEAIVQLPYSPDEFFGVPPNLQIIGTMNTADRSVEALDTALRRRFIFKEMMPNLKALEGKVVDGISLSKLLETINNRIEVLLDRDHTIGHSYFISIGDDKAKLVQVVANQIIPLLQEYFYNDYEKIAMVLCEDFFEQNQDGKSTLRNVTWKYKSPNIDIDTDSRHWVLKSEITIDDIKNIV
jgi:hypothetical protein